jgi:hypothetical protein
MKIAKESEAKRAKRKDAKLRFLNHVSFLTLAGKVTS